MLTLSGLCSILCSLGIPHTAEAEAEFLRWAVDGSDGHSMRGCTFVDRWAWLKEMCHVSCGHFDDGLLQAQSQPLTSIEPRHPIYPQSYQPAFASVREYLESLATVVLECGNQPYITYLKELCLHVKPS